MGQKCLTVRARRGTLKSKAQETVVAGAHSDRKSAGAKRVAVEDMPTLSLELWSKVLDRIGH